MSRNFSLAVLFGTVVAIGVIFFRVIQPFAFSLLFAGILAILFRPAYEWVCRRCYGRRRLAAGLTTFGVILMILAPLSGILLLAATEAIDVGKQVVATLNLQDVNLDDPASAKRLIRPEQYPLLATWLDALQPEISEENLQEVGKVFSNALLGASRQIYERTKGLVTDVITFLIGLVVMILSLYYFLADGNTLLREVQRLSPMEDEDALALFRQFENVCRGVVMGTVVASFMQGIFAGIGFAIVSVDRIWLLVVSTMFFSFIPFLGAAAVWLSVVAFLLFDQRFAAAIFLTIYGSIVVSGFDNLIRAYVIGDRAQMHPLMALVTVLGALQLVGLWGIFIGPMTAAFFYALLNIFSRRLMDQDHDNPKVMTDNSS